MSPLEIKKLVAVLVASFSSSRISMDTVGVYERMLSDLDYVVANAAVERLLATAKFLPTIAEIREACLALSSGEKLPGGEAWGIVLSAIRKYGYVRVPGKDFEWEDRIVAKCVTALGWNELCSSENVQADRARFIELYDKLASTERTRQLADGLPALKRLQAARPDLPAGRERTATSLGELSERVLRLVDGKDGSS